MFANASYPHDASGASIDAVNYQDNDVTIDVTTSRPGLVVLSDNLQPGWRAFVNGRRVPILRANYAFRAVEVAGKASIVFRYRTPGLDAGLVASGLAVLGAIGLVVGPWRRRDPAGGRAAARAGTDRRGTISRS